MSNRERIEKMAMEASATAREKKEKRSQPAASETQEKKPEPRARKSARHATPMKVVWKVYSATGKEVAVFAYPDREKANATAAQLIAKNGVHHFVESAKVPME